MKIIKYDKSRNTSSNSSGSSSGGGSSTTIEGGGSVDLDRTIWGKHDVGDDIDGSMIVNGNVSINVIDNSALEDDDEGESEDYEEGGGNLTVELTTTTKDLEVGNDAYIKNHLYINYKNHSHSTNKKCVGEILNSIETDVAKNKTDIATNKTNISNNSIAIQNNADEIEKLKDRTSTNEEAIENFDGVTEARVMEILNEWKYGAYSRPVILASGIIRKSPVTSHYYWEGLSLDSLGNITLSHENGLMTLSYTPTTSRYSDGKNAHNVIYAVHATQQKSGDTGNDVTNPYIKERSDGAHWFETRFDSNNNKIYIREFHQGNDDNDTWYSDYWGGDGGGIKAVNITIIGYAYWTE